MYRRSWPCGSRTAGAATTGFHHAGCAASTPAARRQDHRGVLSRSAVRISAARWPGQCHSDSSAGPARCCGPCAPSGSSLGRACRRRTGCPCACEIVRMRIRRGPHMPPGVTLVEVAAGTVIVRMPALDLRGPGSIRLLDGSTPPMPYVRRDPGRSDAGESTGPLALLPWGAAA
ncbi:hypothetical protein ACTIVE_4919 [Actinomadura verrucosospora]|uniref:Uncharacterized protein n=1 Tax=Actinomadura verrucosospora TaxID=46165 RepID=A0A7D3W035_ACTVE|nr:hypothetical protein ACTIVE_4919 [Actinomadura verrucosospora]